MSLTNVGLSRRRWRRRVHFLEDAALAFSGGFLLFGAGHSWVERVIGGVSVAVSTVQLKGWR